jgi:hypothetical protein
MNEEERAAVVAWARRRATETERWEVRAALPLASEPSVRIAATAFLAGYRSGRVAGQLADHLLKEASHAR